MTTPKYVSFVPRTLSRFSKQKRKLRSLFYINERRDRDLTILDLNGSLGIDSSNLFFENKLRHLFANGQNQIILNLSAVSKINAAAFGVLVAGHQKAAEVGGQFKICSLNYRALEVSTIMKLVTQFDIFETEKKATESFQIRRRGCLKRQLLFLFMR